MAKLESIGCGKVGFLRQALEENLAEFCEEHGFVVKAGRARYNDTSVTIEVEFAVVDGEGTAMTREVQAFVNNAPFLGLAEDDLNREFMTYDGKKMKIAGMAAHNRKYSIICTCGEKRYKLTAAMVKMYLGRSV